MRSVLVGALLLSATGLLLGGVWILLGIACAWLAIQALRLLVDRVTVTEETVVVTSLGAFLPFTRVSIPLAEIRRTEVVRCWDSLGARDRRLRIFASSVIVDTPGGLRGLDRLHALIRLRTEPRGVVRGMGS
jgi:hypothetical protein